MKKIVDKKWLKLTKTVPILHIIAQKMKVIVTVNYLAIQELLLHVLNLVDILIRPLSLIVLLLQNLNNKHLISQARLIWWTTYLPHPISKLYCFISFHTCNLGWSLFQSSIIDNSVKCAVFTLILLVCFTCEWRWWMKCYSCKFGWWRANTSAKCTI